MFPDYLDGSRVLEYTEKGHFGFISDYDERGNPIDIEICYLAVCGYIGSNEYYLFSCDQRYDVIADGCFDSIDVCRTCHPESENTVWHKKTTPYLYSAAQRKERGGTIYFEFQRGRFRNKFWLDRSVYLHADLFDQMKLYDVFSEAIPDFDYCGVTEVTPAQYETLKALAVEKSSETAELFRELDHWVTNCFQTENVFSILGI